jgi:hypothetical protein
MKITERFLVCFTAWANKKNLKEHFRYLKNCVENNQGILNGEVSLYH